MVGSLSAEHRLRLIDRLASCASLAELPDRVLGPLAEAVEASSSVFVEFADRPGQGATVGRRSYVGERPWSLDLYTERYFRIDPLIEPSLALNWNQADGTSACVTTLPAAGSWRDGEYGRHFLRRCSIAHVLGILVPYRSVLGRQFLCLGFHRPQADRPFGAAAIGLLRQFAAVIGTMLSGIAAREAASVTGAVLERTARAGSGYLVFDQDLMLLHAGGSATADLGLGGAAGAPGVADGYSSLLGELRQCLLSIGPQPGTPPLQLSLVRGAGTAPVRVEVETVATASGRQHIATTSISGRARDLAAALARLGLTSREIEVARLVCAGHSNPEIGRLLGIALRTVENHLRSIFAKAQVSSRTQLVARALP
ncbi:MAG: helix-turn-helix transcriptional regulator [Gammaproteobacteria bacterium]|nr:helix-turn-helix transcriptional regulator [Gammaproteobacteria bacterium]